MDDDCFKMLLNVAHRGDLAASTALYARRIWIAASNLKHVFVLVCLNRFQQIITCHTFQAPNEGVKVSYLQLFLPWFLIDCLHVLPSPLRLQWLVGISQCEDDRDEEPLTKWLSCVDLLGIFHESR